MESNDDQMKLIGIDVAYEPEDYTTYVLLSLDSEGVSSIVDVFTEEEYRAIKDESYQSGKDILPMKVHTQEAIDILKNEALITKHI